MSVACRDEDLSRVALFRHLPDLGQRLPWAMLGDWPTPIEPLRGHSGVFLKREDLSSDVYGGNKVRTLEPHFGRARAEGADRIWATGAFGSNHAVATVLHADRARLQSGAALFPQPPSLPAHDNMRALLTADPSVHAVAHAVTLPAAMMLIARRSRRADEISYLMPPGGANVVGTVGHVSAALELAEQIEAGDCPAPAEIILAVGSGCTTAGLLVGIHLAARLGIGFGRHGAPMPRVVAVRVTPWPITSRLRLAHLARQTSRRLSELVGDIADIPFRVLHGTVEVDAKQFGGGYGKPTRAGRDAIAMMNQAGGPALDVVYSAKSGAALFERTKSGRGPFLFWTTKSTAPLPRPSREQLETSPEVFRDWLNLRPL